MYATVSEFQDRMSRDYDELYRDEDTGEADDDLAEDDLTAASADIDSCLAVRYVTPVTDADALPLLKHWALTLAEELAFLRAGGSAVPDKVAKRVEAVRKQMDRIIDGKTCLPGSPAEKTTGAGNSAYVSTEDPVFTKEKMEGW